MAVLLFKTPLILKTAYETDKIRYEPAKNGFSLEELYLFGEDLIFDLFIRPDQTFNLFFRIQLLLSVDG